MEGHVVEYFLVNFHIVMGQWLVEADRFRQRASISARSLCFIS